MIWISCTDRGEQLMYGKKGWFPLRLQLGLLLSSKPASKMDVKKITIGYYTINDFNSKYILSQVLVGS